MWCFPWLICVFLFFLCVFIHSGCCLSFCWGFSVFHWMCVYANLYCVFVFYQWNRSQFFFFHLCLFCLAFISLVMIIMRAECKCKVCVRRVGTLSAMQSSRCKQYSFFCCCCCLNKIRTSHRKIWFKYCRFGLFLLVHCNNKAFDRCARAL